MLHPTKLKRDCEGCGDPATFLKVGDEGERSDPIPLCSGCAGVDTAEASEWTLTKEHQGRTANSCVCTHIEEGDVDFCSAKAVAIVLHYGDWDYDAVCRKHISPFRPERLQNWRRRERSS